jgi:hypothetical protein
MNMPRVILSFRKKQKPIYQTNQADGVASSFDVRSLLACLTPGQSGLQCVESLLDRSKIFVRLDPTGANSHGHGHNQFFLDIVLSVRNIEDEVVYIPLDCSFSQAFVYSKA